MGVRVGLFIECRSCGKRGIIPGFGRPDNWIFVAYYLFGAETWETDKERKQNTWEIQNNKKVIIDWTQGGNRRFLHWGKPEYFWLSYFSFDFDFFGECLAWIAIVVPDFWRFREGTKASGVLQVFRMRTSPRNLYFVDRWATLPPPGSLAKNPSCPTLDSSSRPARRISPASRRPGTRCQVRGVSVQFFWISEKSSFLMIPEPKTRGSLGFENTVITIYKSNVNCWLFDLLFRISNSGFGETRPINCGWQSSFVSWLQALMWDQSRFLGTCLPSPGLGLGWGWVGVGVRNKGGVGGNIPRNLYWSVIWRLNVLLDCFWSVFCLTKPGRSEKREYTDKRLAFNDTVGCCSCLFQFKNLRGWSQQNPS